MALMKYAKAVVVHPRASGAVWSNIRKTASSVATPSKNLAEQASGILGEAFTTDRFLLTHATIVASVDVDTVPNVKLGTVEDGSRRINRKFADYYIKPECSQFVNNNGDSWSRDVLMKSYRTFIGAHNFLEHVQIEAQSKGRIIDAVARDIGPSVYVDILIATDRKHAQLVQDIESGKLATLSMGCFLPGTMVSLADGTRVPIEDIQPGDLVLTHKGRARPVVNQQIRRRDWSLRRINAVGVPSEIVTTDTHPFFVLRAPAVCACGCGEALPLRKPGRKQTTRDMKRRFKAGHANRVFNPKALYSLDEFRARKDQLGSIQASHLEEVPAGRLQVGDFLCFPRASFDHLPGEAVSEGRATLLGYYLAEGNLLKVEGSPTGVEFTFSLSEEKTYAATVASLLASEFSPHHVSTYTRLDRNTCVVRASGSDVAGWFSTHGGEYSSRKRLSESVMGWPVVAHKALLGAWLNGDGHLDSRGVTSGVTTSYDLACQMHLLAARCGMFVTVQASVRGRSVEMGQAINGGVVVRDEVTGRLPAFTLRFGQTQAQGLVGYTDKVCPSPTNSRQENRVRDDVVMFPITSIEAEPYFGFVYDLEVEEDHSYVVEGVAVHNCTCEFTQCSQCGNVAVDETDMCEHVKYGKLNTFFDEQGQKRITAELCGHATHGDTGGVRFIEASWVAVPAFQGAVMRNILDPATVSPAVVEKAAAILATPPAEWGTSALRAASLQLRQAQDEFDFSTDDSGGDAAPADEKPAEDKKPDSPFADVEEDVYTAIKDRVRQRLEQDINPPPPPSPLPTEPNDNLQREAGMTRVAAQAAHKKAVETLLRVASSDAAFVDGLAEIDAAFGVRVSQSVYRAPLQAGALDGYLSPDQYTKACSRYAKRSLTSAETRFIHRVGKLLDRFRSSRLHHPNRNL